MKHGALHHRAQEQVLMAVHIQKSADNLNFKYIPVNSKLVL